MRLMEFSASWCQSCKQQKPIIEDWMRRHPDVKLEILSVEDPQGAAVAADFMVQSLPTLVMLDDMGTVLAAQSGLHDARRLDSIYEQAQRRLGA